MDISMDLTLDAQAPEKRLADEAKSSRYLSQHNVCNHVHTRSSTMCKACALQAFTISGGWETHHSGADSYLQRLPSLPCLGNSIVWVVHACLGSWEVAALLVISWSVEGTTHAIGTPIAMRTPCAGSKAAWSTFYLDLGSSKPSKKVSASLCFMSLRHIGKGASQNPPCLAPEMYKIEALQFMLSFLHKSLANAFLDPGGSCNCRLHSMKFSTSRNKSLGLSSPSSNNLNWTNV